MKYIFYITNHGFGHASRNVPIIKRLLERDSAGIIYIKSDVVRCEFLNRNFKNDSRIKYFADCSEVGLVLQEGTLEPDIVKMKVAIQRDLNNWNKYIKKEMAFLKKESPDIIISDIVGWPIIAAKRYNIKTVLIGNFSWAQMYKSFYNASIWKPYLECYKKVDKAIWYEIHDKELEQYCKNYECVSMVSREIDEHAVQQIKKEYGSRPIVFVSLGASAEINKRVNVENLPYNFLVTRGLKLIGDNVVELPQDMINTPDYISAADYVIAKGGWSTIAEIMLQRKKCALFFRGKNPEDENTIKTLTERKQCICLFDNELENINKIISNIDKLEPKTYDMYIDDTDKICDIIYSIIKEEDI